MELTIIPKMSEKTVGSASIGTYTFVVPIIATKQMIAQAVSKQYGVKVVGVNTATTEGKVKKSYRKGGNPVTGKRNDVKKAYVRLAEGDKISAFDLPEDAKEAK
jgi:large subunit ribosomal protein L23